MKRLIHIFKDKLPFKIFVLLSGILCVLYIIFFDPVIDGDAGHYIQLAQDISAKDKVVELGNRSPLYPWLMSLIVSITGDDQPVETIKNIQYLLLFFSSIVIYSIVRTVTGHQSFAFLTGIIFLISISTVNYGYLILTETLTVFLFVLGIWLAVLSYSKSKLLLFFSGLVFSALVLARYSTFLLPVFMVLALFILDYKNKDGNHSVRSSLGGIAIFLVPVLVVILSWSYHNYRQNGYFFLFSLDQTGTFVSKNGIYAAIDERTKVQDEYLPYKDIVLDVQDELLDDFKVKEKKESLASYFSSKKPLIYNNGFSIRSRSYQRFGELYKDTGDNFDIDQIEIFEKQVVRNNKMDILKIRIFSFLTGMRASSSYLNKQNEKVNLNILPSVIFIIYKLFVIIFTIIAYLYMLVALIRSLFTSNRFLNYEIILIILTAYFPVVNFIFALTNDANRFKYPSEPFIIMFALLGIYHVSKYIIERRNIWE